MCDSIFLMWAKFNFRVHSWESQMTSIVFTGTDTVKPFIINSYQSFTSLLIFENPILKCCFHGILFLWCQHSFFFIEDTNLIPIFIDTLIIDTNIFQIQCIFQNPVSICPLGSIRCIGKRISWTVCIFPGNPPLTIHLRIFYLYLLLCKIPRSMKQFPHKVLIIRWFNPGCPNPYFDFRCFQFSWLNCFQCTDIRCEFRVILCKGSCCV